MSNRRERTDSPAYRLAAGQHRLADGTALEAVRRKREDHYDRLVRPLDRERDQLATQVATRLKALSGRQHAEAQRILGAIIGVSVMNDLAVTRS